MDRVDQYNSDEAEKSKKLSEFLEYQRRTKKRIPPKYKTFNYEPLPRKDRAIRLLKLLPSSPENPAVECELVTITGKENDRGYEALSWCWGTSDPTAYIHIREDRKIFAKYIRPNLFAALKALRDPVKVRHLWVDDICIDQEGQ